MFRTVHFLVGVVTSALVALFGIAHAANVAVGGTSVNSSAAVVGGNGWQSSNAQATNTTLGAAGFGAVAGSTQGSTGANSAGIGAGVTGASATQQGYVNESSNFFSHGSSITLNQGSSASTFNIGFGAAHQTSGASATGAGAGNVGSTVSTSAYGNGWNFFAVGTHAAGASASGSSH